MSAKINIKLARRHLDEKFKKMGDIKFFMPPAKGWIKAVRMALAMTQVQLAKRLGVAQPRVIALEKDEIGGNLKISTLKKVADALECEFVYALIPKHGLDKTMQRQAKKRAKRMLASAEHTMQLENQPSPKEAGELQLKELISELLEGSQNKLWE